MAMWSNHPSDRLVSMFLVTMSYNILIHQGHGSMNNNVYALTSMTLHILGIVNDTQRPEGVFSKYSGEWKLLNCAMRIENILGHSGCYWQLVDHDNYLKFYFETLTGVLVDHIQKLCLWTILVTCAITAIIHIYILLYPFMSIFVVLYVGNFSLFHTIQRFI